MVDKIKVIVIDDEQRALNRMKLLLQNFIEVEVLAFIEQADTAFDYILRHEPNMVFMDIEMPGRSGLELADDINKNNLDTKIVYISAHDHYAIKAIKTYAFDYLLKPVNIDELKATLERYKTKLLSNLSKREFEIIRLIGKGLNSKAIGERLFISRHTVDTYRRAILEKTSCKNSAELISYATRNNLI
ncbi:response regulator transcription factor [Hyunsoonleella flava]|uniref:Response regulator transcription factor n=1 Tax=Hyunsoonleella flava TaxID=2527939 RepID=A0A4Q9FLS2_9FLAO|nr:response regulator transcription factor [Hyunsoonleella flava]TBN06660.1 response regulator transcription factor [Hyunsoonleella flava]